MKIREIAEKYAATWVNQDVEAVDMGEASSQNDLFLFLVELAERREITALDVYQEEARTILAEEYEQENISESKLIAQTYIVQMKNERLWGVYEEEIKKAIEAWIQKMIDDGIYRLVSEDECLPR